MEKPNKVNPLIEQGSPDATIENVANAMQWLESLTTHESDAFGGVPSDAIHHGRFLLGQCCIEALRFAGKETEAMRRKLHEVEEAA